MFQLSVILVTYNSADYIEKCLRSVINQTHGLGCQIIVVDNHSSDETVEIIKRFQNIQLFQNTENVGFARAANAGIQHAGGQYVLLLNADTLVKEGAMLTLLKKLQTNAKVGIAGGRLENPDGSLQYSMGKFPTITNLLFDRVPVINLLWPVYFQRHAEYYQKDQHPDWVAGSFFMIRREVINSIGLFDEKYFMYMEEVDFCYRAKKAGWLVGFYPAAAITHFDLGKSPEKRYNKAVYQRLGVVRFFEKFYAPAKLKQLKWWLRLELALRRTELAKSQLFNGYQQTLNNSKQ